LPPVVVPVVGALRAGGDDQRVVRKVGAVREHDAFRLGIDVDHLSEQYAHVLLAAEHAAQGRGDLAGRQRAGSNLIKERLEEVIVAPIEERHVHRHGLQRAGRAEAAEPAADYHYLFLHESG